MKKEHCLRKDRIRWAALRARVRLQIRKLNSILNSAAMRLSPSYAKQCDTGSECATRDQTLPAGYNSKVGELAKESWA